MFRDPKVVLGLVVTAVFVFALVIVAFIHIPTEAKEVAIALFGVSAAKFGSVVDFFFGSSKGSDDKNQALLDP